MLCQTGDVNGNGKGGQYSCDIIACSPGSSSPIGRSSPHGGEGEGQETHECTPCHKHGLIYIGNRQCGDSEYGVINVNGGGRIGGLLSTEGDLILTSITVCSTVAIFLLVIAFRTRAARQQRSNRSISRRARIHDLQRSRSGTDTESFCTETTNQSNNLELTKLPIES